MYTGKKTKTFKDRFAQLVEESEKTAMELSKELHVSVQTVSAWKLGVRSPKEPAIIAIANHFHVSVKWLMGFDVEKEEQIEQSSVVIPDTDLFRKIIMNMSPSDYRIVMQIFEKTETDMREKGIL